MITRKIMKDKRDMVRSKKKRCSMVEAMILTIDWKASWT
jgi:hypothetical protein